MLQMEAQALRQQLQEDWQADSVLHLWPCIMDTWPAPMCNNVLSQGACCERIKVLPKVLSYEKLWQRTVADASVFSVG